MARKTKTDTRNIARRFAIINEASNGLLLDLIERYEAAAVRESELDAVSDQIEAQEKAYAKAKSRTGDSKEERAIESRLIALDAKHEAFSIRCERSAEAVRAALERLANRIDSTVLNVMNA